MTSQGHIPFSTAEAWLRARRSLWLASTRPDGRAHAVVATRTDFRPADWRAI